MLTKEYSYIKDEVLKLVESSFSGEITVTEFDGVKVNFDGENAVIGCGSKVQFARGVFLLAQNYKNGAFEITQKPRFKVLNSQLDVARNGVFTLEAIKKWVTATAALGFTHFELFMEDTYELEGYPRFGYMRGRYSKEELKEIGRICERMGVEVIPGVQTLAHFEQYLQWREAAPIMNNPRMLLVDEPKTYELIEKAFALMRECFPNSKILNIMCDEATGTGQGRHAVIYGPEDDMTVYKRHATRVVELCRKYNFEPIMSGDMLIRLKSPRHDHYDRNVVLEPEDAAGLPEDAIISYWDYGHETKEHYVHFIKEYQKIGRKLELGGGIWTWEGFTEDTVLSYNAMVAFSQAAVECGEERFSAYTFGDGGSETNFMYSLGSFAIFSEYCYRGLDCTKEDIFAASEFLTKIPYQNRLDIGRMYSDYHDGYRYPKKFMVGDIFYYLVNGAVAPDGSEIDFINNKDQYDKVYGDMCFAENKAKEFMDKHDENYDYYELCYYVAKLARIKFEMMNKIRPAYKNGDREYLRLIAEEKIPEFIRDMNIFKEIFKKDWLSVRKPFGIEPALLRLAAASEQAYFRSQQITAYLNGEIDKILELEEEIVTDKVRIWGSPRCFTPSAIGLGN